MAINERLIDTEVAAAADGDGAADAEQGLILHLDANDVDSYDGDGDIWYDISEHDVTIPLSDNASNLKCHLNFSDSTSYGGTGTTVTDISDESNDFTFTGITASDFDKDNGGYVDLDNSGDYLERSSTTSGHFDGDYTLELWVNPHENNNFTYFYCKQNASTNGLLVGNFGGSTGQLEVYRYTTSGSANSDTFTGSGITANQWNHVAIVFSGTNGFLYVNGEQKDSSTSFTGTYPSDFTNMRIGGGYSTAFDTNGEIGVFRLYDKTLSASEVGQNYRHGRDYIYTELVDDTDLELHLDPASYSGSGTTWTADTGNDATLVGDASYNEELGDWFELDGSGDYANVATGSLMAGDFTIEMWWSFKDLSGYQMLWGGQHYSASAGGLGHYIEDAKIQTWVNNSSNSSVNVMTSGSVLSTYKWHHIVITRSGSSMTAYVDGVSVATGTYSGELTSPNTRLGGHYNTGLYDVNGLMGQVREYETAFTADEVMQNYLFTKNDYPNGYNGDFDGLTSSDWNSNGYFDFPVGSDNISLDSFGGIDFNQTLVMWVNLGANTNADSGTYRYYLYSQYTGSDYQYFNVYAYDESDGVKLKFYWRDTSGSYYFTESDVDSVWSSGWNMVAVYIAGTEEVYSSVNGNNWAETTLEFGDVGTEDVIPRGNVLLNNARGNTSIATQRNPFSMSQLKVYDKVLTNSELSALNTAGYQG